MNRLTINICNLLLRNLLIKILLLLLVIQCKDLSAQFYNGHQMTFGKNRVQYIDFYWQYYRFDKFDTYFYVNGKEVAQYVSRYVDAKIPEIEYFFEYTLDKRIIFIVYNKHSDFKQSNIGLVTGDDQYNIGGMTQIIDNKVFVFNEGDHQKLEKQLNAAIAEVMLTEMIFGSDIKDKVASSTLLSLPDWYVKGLISYISDDWNFEIENKVKDAIENDRFDKFNRLEGDEAIYAGHSLWRYIGETYGKEVIPNIIYLTRINKNIDEGFLYVLGLPLKELSKEWLNYYKVKYNASQEDRDFPIIEPVFKKPRKNTVYKQVKLSPDAKHIAFATNEQGLYKVWIYDTETGKRKKIIRKGHRLQQITDYSYPVIAWHPSGEILTYIVEDQGHIKLNYYILETGVYQSRELFQLEKILDYHFSDDGTRIVFSAIKNGHTDIIVHFIASNTNEHITKDLADDLHPRFIENSSKILFSSNRLSDTIIFEKYTHADIGNTYDLFVYDFDNRSSKLTRLSDTKFVQDVLPYEINTDSYVYLSDENGIVNRHILKVDSSISYIDTAIHYRYYSNSYPLTNYSRNIIEQDLNTDTKQLAEVIYNDGKYSLYTDYYDLRKNNFSGTFYNTEYRDIETEKLIRKDSLPEDDLLIVGEEQIVPDSIIITPVQLPEKDDGLIDINNYVFEIEKDPDAFEIEEIISDTGGVRYFDNLLVKEEIEIDETDEDGFGFPKQLVYFTHFYTNYLVNQIDFGFLNNSYQTFTGGAVYFNPGFNVFSKIGATDLFEDYKITAGVRFAGNFDSNEYLISVENLKDRIDKQYIFHRQAFEGIGDNFLAKTHAHQLMYLLRFPLNQVASLRFTTSFRHDRTVILSTDLNNLNEDNLVKLWGGLKAEFIFDNTKSLGLNLYQGTRLKSFFEFNKQIDRNVDANLFVVGTDIRHYIKIHRNLIFANRLAASSSFGNTLLIYYLGSVDNWINLSSRTPTFNQDVNIDYDKNWAYQTLATNMRGFSQNIRNGNSFMVLNSEIRWPIVRYFVNRPINNDFVNNFMTIGFFDIGSAWSGWTPWSERDAYNYEEINRGPVTAIIDKNKGPFVAGYGFGLRSRLLGYYIRADWAWGIEQNEGIQRRFYLSLNLDF